MFITTKQWHGISLLFQTPNQGTVPALSGENSGYHGNYNIYIYDI